MLKLLQNRTFRALYLAQIVALIGTGLATVALGLLAYRLAGGAASVVLGLVFAIKMVAYVTIAPIAGALAERLPRRRMLIALDLVRGAAAACLPFVTEPWQIYVLIFVLQAASAGFTPVFQAVIPDVVPDEGAYTRALSLSRLAYDLEAVLSPMLAALLLLFLPLDVLFLGTVLGFAASAALILTVRVPDLRPTVPRGFFDRTTRGIRLYLATPRLRGLLALNLAVAAAGSMVLVNTVVLVQHALGLSQSAVALSLAAFSAGSMAVALALPGLLDRVAERSVMLAGAGVMIAGLGALAVGIGLAGLTWALLLLAWVVIGLGYSGVMTPAGRLLRRSAHAEDRPAIFAAQFALSHACWLIAYPLAGVLMALAGAVPTLLVLGALAALGLGLARTAWPDPDPETLPHAHDDLPPDHPHLRGGSRHAHAFVIDDLHPEWPRP